MPLDYNFRHEERPLAEFLTTMARYGYGYTSGEVRNIADEYAAFLRKERTTPLTKGWYEKFMRRHPHLKVSII